MIDRKFSTALTSSIFTISLMLSSQAMAAFTAKEAAELDTNAATTLETFKATAKGTDGVFANAKGILVCPKIRKAGLGVGVERAEDRPDVVLHRVQAFAELLLSGDHYASDPIRMAVEVLGGRMHDEVGAELKGPL